MLFNINMIIVLQGVINDKQFVMKHDIVKKINKFETLVTIAIVNGISELKRKWIDVNRYRYNLNETRHKYSQG